MRKLVFLCAVLLARTAQADVPEPTSPRYVEETKSSGIASVYSGEWQYMVGGGATAFDCNGDGYPELLLAGGEGRASFYRNISRQGKALRFKKQKSGLELDKVTGAYPLDVDSDGIMDVVLLRVGENKVMRGRGNCRFSEANSRWGFDGGDGWSTAFSAMWEKGASWPTLAVGNYIDRKQEISPWGSCTDNWLHRPKAGASGFSAPEPLKPSYCSLSMLFTDWNRSGTPSLRVSNDREYYEGGEEQMWRVEPGKPAEAYGEKDGWKRLRIWGMGIASDDMNGDGFPDFYLTSMADHKMQVLANPPKDGVVKPDYKDIAWPSGVTAHRPSHGDDLRSSTGWQAQFEDVNNDGLNDLFVAKGNVDRMPDFAAKDPNNLFIRKSDGKFTDMAEQAGVASTETSRGGLLVDFNLDGLMDLVVVNRRASAQLWRNTTENAGYWMQLKLQQPGSNRDAIGSWIEVRHGGMTLQREITSGGGHVSGQLGWWHFGLGADASAEVRVQWPDGTVGPWQTVRADGFYVIAPKAEPQGFKPKT